MQLFYSDKIGAEQIELEGDEAKHCTRTLRKQIGDVVAVTDGQGRIFQARLTELSKKSCHLQVESVEQQPAKGYGLRIAFAPTKNNTRNEWFLEKATEIGIDEVFFITTAHSERRNLRLDRLRRVVLAAAKQSVQAHIPRLHELQPFSDFLAQATTLQRFIAHCQGSLPLLGSSYQCGRDNLVLIGPEGDFTPAEIEAAVQAGFQGISLGPSRLRTETAAVQACSWIRLLELQG